MPPEHLYYKEVNAQVVSPKGKIFVRAVAMQFDRYLRESDRAGGYSRIA